MANWAWLAPNPRKAPQTGLLVRTAIASHVDVGDAVRAAGVTGRPLEHLHAHRCVRSRSRRSCAASSAVRCPSASQPARYSMRIGWRFGCMSSDSSRDERALDRTLAAATPPAPSGPGCSCPPCRRRRRRWTPARRSPASVDSPSTDAIWLRSSHTPWPPEYTCRRAVGPGHGQRRLGFEEGVLDPLGLEHLVHDGGRWPPGPRRRRRARRSRRCSTLRVGAPHRDLGIVDGGHRIGDRAEHVVGDLDQLGGVAGRLPASRPRRRPGRRRGRRCGRRRGSSPASRCG